MLTHARLAEDLLRQLAEYSEMVFMELHGKITPELRAAVERMPNSLTIFDAASFNP
ncbi:hypothetical protein MOQ72_28805 [Saccharopolyspora sp. K220]|uniref:hypothetical protein n=1 Tax=Saccharopolyspora soli TaxID=2926618 RepID=UPI001F5960EA|nr:hypothetical protein [Saccharopolyspora soli]MCI2421441.1 hypothetical protein [Saccharopolyspora soli]